MAQSVLNWGHYQALLSACRDVLDDIDICFDLNQDVGTTMCPPAPHHNTIDSPPTVQSRAHSNVMPASPTGHTVSGPVEDDVNHTVPGMKVISRPVSSLTIAPGM